VITRFITRSPLELGIEALMRELLPNQRKPSLPYQPIAPFRAYLVSPRSTLGGVYQLDFADFNETEFEEFCFELLKGLPGFHNVDWRKGTPKSSSPADRGRDIAAEVDHVDVDGARHVETWFVDCKHYERGVPRRLSKGC